MSDMWRPGDWKNPNAEYHNAFEGIYSVQDSVQDAEYEAYEAGADAMLEALKEKSQLMTPEQMKLIAPDRKYPYGWLVFIPEDE